MLAPLLLSLFMIWGASADDVLVFTDANFVTEVAKHETILVEFYAPWCGHCKKLAPEYEAAAEKLKKRDPPLYLAKVDCTVETSTCSKYGVSGYPTLKIFKNGEFSKEYDGAREGDAIMKKMIKESGPVSKELKSVEEVKKFIAQDAISVIGYLDTTESAYGRAFMASADSLADLRFAHTTDADVRNEMKQTEQTIILYRPKSLQSKFEDAEVKCSEPSKDKIKSFLKREALGLCGERTMNNAGDFEQPIFVAYFNVDFVKNPSGTKYWRNRVMKVGKKIKDEGTEVSFAISDSDSMSRELEECGLSSSDKPVVCAFDKSKMKYKMTEEFSMDTFEQFIRDVLAGKVEAHMKSEDVPEDNDTPGKVKVVVAKNFDSIVNDPTKDVLIEFYAPWCGHCKSLAPKYDELAEKLAEDTDVVIAKMDATANDVPGNYDVRGFPTIYFAPKNSKNSPKKYESGREVKDFIKYLNKEVDGGLQSQKKKKKAKKSEL